MERIKQNTLPNCDCENKSWKYQNVVTEYICMTFYRILGGLYKIEKMSNANKKVSTLPKQCNSVNHARPVFSRMQ